ncbi:protein unc-93 homolog A-like [Asterias amurensis]|uniref:protein unc-93 homolog A-like n=1 Tax=Asterias amurensis TaxID=7602 RepID=UPI003AB765AE
MVVHRSSSDVDSDDSNSIADEAQPVSLKRDSNSSQGKIRESSRPSVFTLSPAKKHKLNVIVLSVAFLFNFTAFCALQNLQSSLNAVNGVASLAVIYGALIISCLFAPTLIRIIGTKWSIVISVACFSLYTACNFYPVDYILLPGGVLVGLAAAPLWISQGTYLTTSAFRYAELMNEVPEAVVNQFNGIFFFFFQSSQISGNLVASLVLYPSSNATVHSLESFTHCGVNSCSGGSSTESDHPLNDTESSSNTGDNLSTPSMTVTILLGVYLACGGVSFLIATFLLDKLPKSEDKASQETNSNLSGTFRLFLHPNLLLLVPLFIYTGMEQGFFFGDFTKAFITCTSGVHYVGFIMMVFGISDAIFSFTLGRLEKYCGRIIIFTAGGLAHLSLILVILFVWNPGEALWDRFLIAVVWGFGDAVLQTQICSIVGVIFPENQERAFSCFRLGQAFGFCLYFAVSLVGGVCVIHKIIFLGGLLICQYVCYYTLEWRLRRVSTHDVLSNSGEAEAVKNQSDAVAV